jgi:hypothetical protein
MQLLYSGARHDGFGTLEVRPLEAISVSVHPDVEHRAHYRQPLASSIAETTNEEQHG